MSAVAVNPAWPGLIASCSGQRNHSRRFSGEDDDQPWNIDNTLKLWKYAGKIATHLDAEPADFGPYPLPDEVVPDIDREGTPDVTITAQDNITSSTETRQVTDSTVITENQVAMNCAIENPGYVTTVATIESTVLEQNIQQT